ncbi:DNA oxidative demethylase ALKBH2 [Penaeus vannamei]|uniref:DNA oxidative demethylase ALKBH2 n=2 Tax=Penaeus TaxID=133894 RepID=UPI00387F7669
MGEHKDDEKDLDHNTPIASLSLGQSRDFYFRHQDARPPKSMKIEKVSLLLEHGSLLLMNPPTNNFWYHALPPRKSAGGLRINLTFRKILRK